MSSKDYDDVVLHHSPEPSIKWIPEDYGFVRPNDSTNKSLWYYKNYELRALQNDYWLLRRKVKNDNGNTEMLQKWYIKLTLQDKEFADIMFTKGLL